MYTTATAFIDALVEQGIEYMFVNLGSDHPGLVEAIAKARAEGRPVPRVITCPNEMVALTIAHGFTQVTGRPQAVVIHVECGTQALAGAVHNAAKARIPVLIFAGSSPFTQDGELLGSRNEFIQWIQDVHDQRGLVRGYMRYDNEIRTGANVKQVVHRAMQFARTDPKGPVYLMAAREVLEASCEQVDIDIARWGPVSAPALGDRNARSIAGDIAKARRPLVVTSYLGRNPAAARQLASLCDRYGIGVVESVPSYVNVPHGHDCFLGSYWNDPRQNEALAEADLVLVIDSDVPWIPAKNRPSAHARILHIDIDPLKEQMPLWYIEPHGAYRADAETALAEISEALSNLAIDQGLIGERRAHYARLSAKRRARLASEEAETGALTTARLMASVRTHLGNHAIVINEGITNYQPVFDHIAPNEPGTMFASGGGSLGYNGGAAIGAKLASPDATVVAISGDGTYMFTVPSSVHWIARRYDAPFLQIVLNNDGWNAPRHSALAVHPDGYASRAETLDLSFSPAPDYGGIAKAAGNAEPIMVDRESDLDEVMARAFAILRNERRSVLVEARLG
ncbi:thiamine pyrophosphate-requiring protein [Novosphingobium taihuense]|uniref:Acetolactate synthase-1/2/3 large subunit n=1 Tax=Novosphingobium taihuense TaxID=260085 RepID=A0A7W7A9E0_9SPHN|nr:thiamine pyrophosphate-requiring protein [Novosphingobium taihuense]MBB4612853.1 acetolactate synthase-1/2/3 large subunit [Novosphingobium taihuense]TWH81958.1 acetolactate synthase-1/2/3 large subunit [Novosphingobium taihuense]